MFKQLNILDESDKRLRKKSDDVVFPLSEDYQKNIKNIIKHLKYSQIDDLAEKYKLRPGMGLAFPQLGIRKRIIVIVHEVEEGKFDNYVVVNPIITSNSVEKIAAEVGEGCLSVNRDVVGHVPRYARVTIEGFDEFGQKLKIRAREELAIAFQHEIDHLNGILFYDHINPKRPLLGEDNIRLI